MIQLTVRKSIDRAVGALCLCAALISGTILFIIIGYLFFGALPALNLQFLVMSEIQSGTFDGAIGNAIAGTLLISILSVLIASPFAIGTAIYLARYAPENRYTQTLRFFIEVLSGTPSIVIGIFGFLLFAVYMKKVTGGFSLIGGAVALAILILPVIERAVEEAITAVSHELEEGSYALGATKWQTIRDITIPTAISGIITGIILSFGRAAEESAVVLFTTGYSQFYPEFAVRANPNMFMGIKIYPLQDLVGTLPLSVYNAYEHSNIVPMANGFAAAFVLICIVLSINLSAKIVITYSMNGTKRKNGVLHSIATILTGIPTRFSFAKKAQPAGSCSAEATTPVQDTPTIPATVLEPAVPAPVPSSLPAPHPVEHPVVPSPQPRNHPSITDGFAGIILASAGMTGFLGLIYAVRFLTKDASLDAGSVILVVVLNAIVLGVAAFQYLRLNWRKS